MTTTRTGAELFVDALTDYGVERVFGNPGTTELPVVRAIGESDLQYVLALHEDVAVGMAGGYAQTRRYAHHRGEDALPVGVVNLHTTGGTAHGLGNLYNADVGGVPLVVTAGHHSTDFAHEEPILSGDLEAMTDQFCKWAAEVPDVAALPTMLRRAVRVAMTPPTGPVFLGLPLDVMAAETAAGPERLGAIPTAGRGDREQVERAADLLAEATGPVLVVGDEVARSGVEAVEAAVDLAEAAGARVHGEALASEVNFPADHDQWVSHVPPSEELFRTVMSADVVALVGTSTHTTLTRHEEPLVDPDTTDLVHVGADARELGKNVPADAAVHGDPGTVMDELADLVAERVDDGERQSRLEQVEAFQELAGQRMAELGESDVEDPRPSKADLVDAMRAVAPDAYVVDESVSARFAMLTRWPHAPEQFLGDKGNALGYGVPAAIGAAMAEAERPDPRTVVGFVGDGSYLYYPQAVYSAARHGVDLAVVVPDNRTYRILKDNAADMYDVAAEAVDYPGLDFDPHVAIPANAESHGATGHLVEDPDDLAGTLRTAIAEDGPSVVDVLVHD